MQAAWSSPDKVWSPSIELMGIAAREPDRPAIISPLGNRSYAELNARTNRLVRALRRRGAGPLDQLCVVSANRPEFAEAAQAGLRMGLRVTPVNWHLTAEEMAYVLRDCGAAAIVGDARFGEVVREASSGIPVRLAVGGVIEGFEDYERALGAEAPDDIDDPIPGITMLYTSGTTGRPKGVFRRGRQAPSSSALTPGGGQAEGGVHLCTGPLYHAAPLLVSLNIPLSLGMTVVLMDGFDAEECLRLIERHRVTHTHMVATMFHRLLSLAADVRTGYDTASLRYVVHGAAPCPVHVKQALIDWLGPIVHEYYAATEGAGTVIGPEEWLLRPGTVGRSQDGQIQIRGPDGNPLPQGGVGVVYLKSPEIPEFRFEYLGDPHKTAGAYDGDYFTLGDMGYLDDEGYLFLTDRSADVIISGGVNVYPAEIDAVLLTHPAVADACTVGVPNDEWGEEVKAVVELRAGREASADELVEHCRGHLAGYKCPRTIDFVDALPRHDTGKLYRRLVRDPYWAGKDRNI